MKTSRYLISALTIGILSFGFVGITHAADMGTLYNSPESKTPTAVIDQGSLYDDSKKGTIAVVKPAATATVNNSGSATLSSGPTTTTTSGSVKAAANTSATVNGQAGATVTMRTWPMTLKSSKTFAFAARVSSVNKSQNIIYIKKFGKDMRGILVESNTTFMVATEDGTRSGTIDDVKTGDRIFVIVHRGPAGRIEELHALVIVKFENGNN